MKAVHFGAGNIGRGFVGLILHEAGYEVVFADVNAELIGHLASADSYRVTEVGPHARDWTVTGFRAIDSAADGDALIQEIATADVVTTAVGPAILRFVAPAIAAGLRARSADLGPVAVMACENAINATDTLRAEIETALGDDTAALTRAVFANTAVDRIVPNQDPAAGLDVTVEDFSEWVVERTPFGDAVPEIAGATFVDDLAPYIERKLFTVNTGHATVAYHGYARGAVSQSDAMAIPEVADEVRQVLEETSALLVAKHGLDEAEQAAYREKNLARFANAALADTVERVGRQPLRKLSREERFVGPASQLAERGLPNDALVRAMGQALRFDPAGDPQALELQGLLATDTAADLVRRVTGLEDQHPLTAELVALVDAAQADRRSAPRHRA
ncbi:mannitol-1-phosphate 5-dehydrogenase [Clavibacter lycopersici]|uniref:Mannitol-1-phosphate 5-dehydrogenase n=1 Tax=Clavibacter lycopersici TaxID=2301718 RepID=A0A399T886_9MICO|nr:mannitol-1-phosphate 5-dehydrogenase [Clavibacter lycopersici]RIJ51264.1 mannitol-1-phosphate 5-dehydrogenase [Clavibacter lycopersici]RIJ59593.1 mannitol-1-phosphate 5-dehydrogenase [Clavibacter lycopersici]